MALRRVRRWLCLVLLVEGSALAPPRRRPVRSRLVARNSNDPLDGPAGGAWQATKRALPPLITGAWDDSAGDDDPLGAFSNLLLVRAPCLALAGYYGYHLATDGAPLVVDFGFDDVPTIIPPGAVWTILGLLLLPIL